jgi:predicted nuclease of predicted toxin-antitoxin system
MRFLADMCVSLSCVEWLRSQGHDAIHLFEQKLHMLPDIEVLRKAISENRILLTMDLDFAGLLSGAKTGVLPLAVIFRLSDPHPQNIQTMMETIMPIIENCAKQGNAILSVGDEKVRIRHLPIT